VISLVVAGLLNACVALYPTYFLPERPNIILISIDALRPDHMGCYGYHRNTTPNIDKFAQEAVLFKTAFAHEPWTLPSHMSMLTGLYTITHGVYNLSPRILTLTELLKNAGYRTIASAYSYFMMPIFGFWRGFDRYMWLQSGDLLDDPLRVAEYQNQRIVEQIKKNQSPFFAFIHYYDVHSNMEYLPYDAPPPFNRMFTADNGTEFHFRVPNIYASEYLRYIHDNKIELSEAERQHIIDLYDNGIAYMDHCIGELFQSLKAMGLYDDTMIIITADHGEEFQEHGGMLHSNPYYYDVLMHVPLIVKLPESSSERTSVTIDSLVEIITTGTPPALPGDSQSLTFAGI